jgi:hypothetical protein
MQNDVIYVRFDVFQPIQSRIKANAIIIAVDRGRRGEDSRFRYSFRPRLHSDDGLIFIISGTPFILSGFERFEKKEV